MFVPELTLYFFAVCAVRFVRQSVNEVEMTEKQSGLDVPSRVNTIDEARRKGTLAADYEERRAFRAEWRTNIKSKDETTEEYISEMQWTQEEARGIIIRAKGWIQVCSGANYGRLGAAM